MLRLINRSLPKFTAHANQLRPFGIVVRDSAPKAQMKRPGAVQLDRSKFEKARMLPDFEDPAKAGTLFSP